ncbi:hypothetical protein CVT25_003354 [Psilocybe cyanescens]|uniref:Uncharacterized protein n=1 Tax=Psilocybe cyanescens TaxID=93625 RepID=A0A409XQP1_PSICY|nr:hypothetical protein CVT25_003354 [Psilocybe cyanescens]
MYETIEDEILNSNHTSPVHSVPYKKSSTSQTTRQAVFIVDSDTVSFSSSPRIAFQAPGSPAGMQSLLQHSTQNYDPLLSELCSHRVRSCTISCLSPYPQGRTSRMTLSLKQKRSTATIDVQDHRTPVLQQVLVNWNTRTNRTWTKDNGTAPFLGALKAFSPHVVDDDDSRAKRENTFRLAPNARLRVGSSVRRTALGWSKRSTGAGKSSTDQKENAVSGVIAPPGDNVRLSRPDLEANRPLETTLPQL